MLRRETFSLAGTLFLGGVIGAFIALEISTHFAYGSYLWILGILMGAMIAYCAVDFREFCSGVARAYRKTIAWKPEVLFWQAVAASFMALTSIISTACLALMTVLLMRESLLGTPEHVWEIISLFPTILGVGFAVILSLTGICVAGALLEVPGRGSDLFSDRLRDAKFKEIKGSSWKFAREYNPLAVISRILRGIWNVARKTPAALRWIKATTVNDAHKFAQFLGWSFAYVHSKRRRISFVSVAIGATIGFFLGSSILGGIAGLIVGIILHEVIAVRWLKLVPA